MSNLTPMSEYLKGLPTMVKREDCAILNLVGGILKTIPQHILQETACQLRGAANTINLDTDKVCGFFSLRQCSGTKPTEYGVAIVFGGGSDFYQLVIGSNGRIYHRANINNIPKPWLCLANDASYVSPSVGGGKTLSFNHLRNYTERRWVA